MKKGESKMLENKKVKTIYGDVYYSRIIASWMQVKGSSKSCFSEWLEALKDDGIVELSDEDIIDIKEMRSCGKFELESNARKFMEKNKCSTCDGENCGCDKRKQS